MRPLGRPPGSGPEPIHVNLEIARYFRMLLKYRSGLTALTTRRVSPLQTPVRSPGIAPTRRFATRIPCNTGNATSRATCRRGDPHGGIRCFGPFYTFGVEFPPCKGSDTGNGRLSIHRAPPGATHRTGMMPRQGRPETLLKICLNLAQRIDLNHIPLHHYRVLIVS